MINHRITLSLILSIKLIKLYNISLVKFRSFDLKQEQKIIRWRLTLRQTIFDINLSFGKSAFKAI